MAEQALNGLSQDTQEKPVILIADDSRVVRVSLKNILKNDCQLIEAEDGLQAWELLLEHPHIQLIFSDLSMPRLDGRGLLRKIRQSEINRIRNLPFIVVTGNEEDAAVRQALQESGATEMVRKPFDPASIVSFVNTLVAKQEDESYFILPDEQAQHEFLPGVINQHQFMENAGRELSFAIRNKNELAVALLKIDQFDTISSHYSDPAVEHILLTTSEIIRQHIHPDDTMAYFGEGLYAILRPASNAIGTRYIGRRIIDDLTAKQFYLGETDEAVSASVGISAPEIKHGTRLRELLLLAEGRLKAAMDLGGNRVVDKGNDTLTPVSGLMDSSQELTTNSGISTQSSAASGSHGDRMAVPVEPAQSEISSPQANGDLLQRITELNKRMEQLSDENRELQTQVERWRRQSAESEQLRQRVFELESEQQQMRIRMSELQTESTAFKKQAETAERDKAQLIESEEERTATLKQASQFYEEENLRLEGQLDALSNRAQKAEAASRKSEQLVTSLKDNVALLRMQLKQVQDQLELERQAPAPAPQPQVDEPNIDLSAEEPEQSQLTDPPESDLIFDGFPSSETVLRQKAPVVKMFPDKPVAQRPAVSKPAEPILPEPQNLSIPVYRVEHDRSPLPKERKPLSSFTIASLILFLLLAVGMVYLYGYMQDDKVTVSAEPLKERVQPDKPSEPATAAGKASTPQIPPDSASPATAPSGIAAAQAPVAATPPQGGSPLSEEAKLEAELTLRQMAEEEFYQQLLQNNETAEQPSTAQAEDLRTTPSSEQSAGEVSVAPAQTEAASSANKDDTPPSAGSQSHTQSPQ